MNVIQLLNLLSFKVQRRSYIKLNLGEKQADVYSVRTHITDGMYHTIQIRRKSSLIELYIDGLRVEFEEKVRRLADQRIFLAQRRLIIGSFSSTTSSWNGIIAGR